MDPRGPDSPRGPPGGDRHCRDGRRITDREPSCGGISIRIRISRSRQPPWRRIVPMVGTAYVSPEPGAAPFVQVGAQVSEGQTVLIIEAMKTMNPIPASKSGTVKHILVSDGVPVEYGEVLMIVE